MKCAMFPAANGGSMLVIQSCSGVNDGIGTGSGRCSSNSAYRATIHIDNDGMVSKETCYKVQTTVIGTVGPVPINKNRPAPIQSTVDRRWFRISTKICSNSSCNRILLLQV